MASTTQKVLVAGAIGFVIYSFINRTKIGSPKAPEEQATTTDTPSRQTEDPFQQRVAATLGIWENLQEREERLVEQTQKRYEAVQRQAGKKNEANRRAAQERLDDSILSLKATRYLLLQGV